MPLWKRNIIGKKQKKSYVIETGQTNGVSSSSSLPPPQDVTAGSHDDDVGETSPSATLPEISRNPWIRSHGLKKKKSPPLPQRCVSSPDNSAMTPDQHDLDQNSNYHDNTNDYGTDTTAATVNVTATTTTATTTTTTAAAAAASRNTNTPTTNGDEVSYGKGFVNRLLQRFKHMTNTEKTRMFDSNTTSDRPSRPLSSGDLISDLSLHDMENRERLLSDESPSTAANSAPSNRDFSRARSMEDLLSTSVTASPVMPSTPEPVSSRHTYTYCSVDNVALGSGDTVDSLSSTKSSEEQKLQTLEQNNKLPLQEDDESLTNDSPDLVIASVSSRRDRFESELPTASAAAVPPVRPPRRLKRQAPKPPTPPIILSPKPQLLSRVTSEPAITASTRTDHHLSSDDCKLDGEVSHDISATPSLRAGLSISIENTTTESTDEQPEPDHHQMEGVPLINRQAQVANTEVTRSKAAPLAPRVPVSPPRSLKDKTLTDWLKDDEEATTTTTSTTTSSSSTEHHQHVSYIRRESIDESGQLIGAVCGTTPVEAKPPPPVVAATKPAITRTKPTIPNNKPTPTKPEPVARKPDVAKPVDCEPKPPRGVVEVTAPRSTFTMRSASSRAVAAPPSSAAPSTGGMLIRPASNLTVNGNGSSLVRLQTEMRDTCHLPAKSYDDITTGDFAPVKKRPSYYADSLGFEDDDSDDEYYVPETNMDDALLAEGEEDLAGRSRSRSKIFVIGGGVSLGKNMLDKTPTRKVSADDPGCVVYNLCVCECILRGVYTVIKIFTDQNLHPPFHYVLEV